VRRAALGGLLALAAALTACGGDEADAQRVPPLELPALDGGEPLDLAELHGPAVINLWATWCEPCRRELPEFQAASGDHVDVRFLGVDIGEDPSDARAFLDELGVTFEQYADEEGELSDRLGVAALPVTLVLDADGEIAERHLGPMSRAELDDALAEV
jgi:thiol-disulfide isomerase/thioredoxin